MAGYIESFRGSVQNLMNQPGEFLGYVGKLAYHKVSKYNDPNDNDAKNDYNRYQINRVPRVDAATGAPVLDAAGHQIVDTVTVLLHHADGTAVTWLDQKRERAAVIAKVFVSSLPIVLTHILAPASIFFSVVAVYELVSVGRPVNARSKELYQAASTAAAVEATWHMSHLFHAVLDKAARVSIIATAISIVVSAYFYYRSNQ